MPARNGPRPDQIAQPTGTTSGYVLTAGALVPSFEESTGTGGGGGLAPTGPISVGIPIALPLLNGTEVIAQPALIAVSDFAGGNFVAGDARGERFEFSVPEDYDSGDIEILMTYKMSTADPAADVLLEVDLTIADIVTGVIDNPPGRVPIAIIPPSSTATTRETLFSIVEGDFAAGDAVVVTIVRPGSNPSLDHLGDLHRIAYSYRYTGQIQTRVISITSDFFLNTDEPSSTAGNIQDFETVDYPSSLGTGGGDTEQKVTFQIPDHWNETSDAQFRITYAMSSPDASASVLLDTDGQIANTVDGTIDAISSQTFLLSPPSDTSIRRTVVIRSISGSALARGDSVILKLARRDAGTGEHVGDLQVISITMTLGIAPAIGVSTEFDESYLVNRDYRIISVSGVNAEQVSADFSGDFETWSKVASTVASGRANIEWQGQLRSTQSKITSIKIPIKGSGPTGPTPEYLIKIYAEGSGATPVYTGILTPEATGSRIVITLTDTNLSSQPTGERRFFVVVEAHIDSGEELYVGTPFVRKE
tara:strand:+ start:58088 stop:59689 length:1602 start_codon:yes stop_codon:yes gene_type:complete